MTYPQQPGYAPQGYPAQQPGFPVPQPQGYAQPPAQGGYPAQQPGYPTAPAQGGYPTQQPSYPMGVPQGYPQQMQSPPVQLAAGSLDEFYSQPASGWGPSWSWTTPTTLPIGSMFVGVVARDITSGDVEQQVNNQGQPQTYRDGRARFVMKVPMNVPVNPPRYADGRAQWYVQGQARDELVRAMHAVGAPEGPPEAGALVFLTLSGERRNTFGTMSKQVTVQYVRPGPEADQWAQQNGIALASAQGEAPPQAPVPQQVPVQPAPQQQYAVPQAPVAPQPQQYAAPAMQQPVAQIPQQVAPMQAPPAPPAQPQAPAPMQQAPMQQAAPQLDPSQLPQLSPEQQQLLAGLVGGQQPAQVPVAAG